jgi:hypothetical protein
MIQETRYNNKIPTYPSQFMLLLMTKKRMIPRQLSSIHIRLSVDFNFPKKKIVGRKTPFYFGLIGFCNVCEFCFTPCNFFFEITPCNVQEFFS